MTPDAPRRPSAYLDESVHDDHGLYVIAAVLATADVRALAHRDLPSVLPSDRLPHWHMEDDVTRRKLVSAVAGLRMEARVYGCRFGSPRKAESARARALTWFVSELDIPVDAIVLDRRQRSQDEKDRRVLAGLLRRSPGTSYRHVPYASEPLLWVADVVVGAVCATWLRGQDYLSDGLDTVASTCAREL